MPLLDHFHPPVETILPWSSIHAAWPVMLSGLLQRRLPSRYTAMPSVHSAHGVEIDVATFHDENAPGRPPTNGHGGVATAVWAPALPSLAVASDLPAQDEYAVHVYDNERQRRLVAAVEIVSPANKDRPEKRRDFVGKCAGLLRERVCVVVVDIVTTRRQNLYLDLLDHIGRADANVRPEQSLMAATLRMTRPERRWQLEAWAEPLRLGEPLPTMPLWLADDLAVPLELEEGYMRALEWLRPG